MRHRRNKSMEPLLCDAYGNIDHLRATASENDAAARKKLQEIDRVGGGRESEERERERERERFLLCGIAVE
jgi:hypothetical protein